MCTLRTQVADFGLSTRPKCDSAESESRRASMSRVGAPRHSSAGSVQSLTKSMDMLATLGAGTPLWMAPEVVHGRHGRARYGLPVDVYSYCRLSRTLSVWSLCVVRMPCIDCTGGHAWEISNVYIVRDTCTAHHRQRTPPTILPIDNASHRQCMTLSRGRVGLGLSCTRLARGCCRTTTSTAACRTSSMASKPACARVCRRK